MFKTFAVLSRRAVFFASSVICIPPAATRRGMASVCFSRASVPVARGLHQEKDPHLPSIFHVWRNMLYSLRGQLPSPLAVILENHKSSHPQPQSFFCESTPTFRATRAALTTTPFCKSSQRVTRATCARLPISHTAVSPTMLASTLWSVCAGLGTLDRVRQATYPSGRTSTAPSAVTP